MKMDIAFSQSICYNYHRKLNWKWVSIMIDQFRDSFRITIDTSACTSLITGYDAKLNDVWYYSDQVFESGKVYGIVSEYGQGCAYLSYLLGGRVDLHEVKVYCNGSLIQRNDLKEVSWNLEPSCEPYGKKQVRKSIEKVICDNVYGETFQSIAERFLLTPERYDRKFIHLSGERWRAASALGYALNKRIFFAPYEPSIFYYQMCQSSLLKALRSLTSSNALVILPTGSDEFIKHIADEVIYVDPHYDIDDLRNFYSQRYNDKWIT